MADAATQLALLLEPIRDETPDEDAPTALSNAKAHATKIHKDLPGLIDRFGKDKVTEWVKQRRAVRKEAAEVEAKKAAKVAALQSIADQKAKAAADAQAKEEAKQATLATLNVHPSTAGPAFTKLNNVADRANLLQWVHLTYPSFSGLTDADLRSEQCLLYHLSANELASVNTYLDGKKVTRWKISGIPSTRGGGQLAGASTMLMPVEVSDLMVELGAEIFYDWVVPYPGHSAKVTRIISSVNYVRTTTPMGVVRSVASNGKVKYEFNGGKYLIMSAAEDAVITYFDT